MGRHQDNDSHVSDLVVSPEQTLAILLPHLPCGCSSCVAATLMTAAGLVLGRRYDPRRVGRMWRAIVQAGEKIAVVTSATHRPHPAPSPAVGDIEATKKPAALPSTAILCRGAH